MENDGLGTFWTLLPGTQSNHNALPSPENPTVHSGPAQLPGQPGTLPRPHGVLMYLLSPSVRRGPSVQERGFTRVSYRRLGRGVRAKGIFSARLLAGPAPGHGEWKLGDPSQAFKPRSFFKASLSELVTADCASPPRAGCTPGVRLVF